MAGPLFSPNVRPVQGATNTQPSTNPSDFFNQWSDPVPAGTNTTTAGGPQNNQQGQQVAQPGTTISQQVINPLQKFADNVRTGQGGIMTVIALIALGYVAYRLTK